MVGKTVAQYEVEGRLGEGGSGVVYRGRDLRLDRQVAIKVLSDALRDDELAWGRLLREARLASQLIHAHIAAIYDLGEEDGRAYIVMEYVEGMPLGDLVPEGGMPTEQVERYARQIAGALDFAHQQGVIHGDLKGSNIVVTSEGNIKLLDFGLGRRIPRTGMAEVTSSSLPLAEAGATAGTLPYLAPEVLRGGASSRQSDIWSLGVLLYQMATGELPFRGATAFELSVEIMVGTPSNLAQLPEPLQSVLRRCLEKDPEARLAQMGELVSMLDANGLTASLPPALPGTLPVAGPASPPDAPAVPNLRKWWATGLATVLSLLLLGVIYGRRLEAPEQAARPASEAPVPKALAVANPTVKVWVNTDSGTYHCPGTKWYGKTQTGEYMTQKQAQDKGYHAAAHRVCR